jgi:hypothetical protein
VAASTAGVAGQAVNAAANYVTNTGNRILEDERKKQEEDPILLAACNCGTPAYPVDDGWGTGYYSPKPVRMLDFGILYDRRKQAERSSR